MPPLVSQLPISGTLGVFLFAASWQELLDAEAAPAGAGASTADSAEPGGEAAGEAGSKGPDPWLIWGAINIYKYSFPLWNP